MGYDQWVIFYIHNVGTAPLTFNIQEVGLEHGKWYNALGMNKQLSDAWQRDRKIEAGKWLTISSWGKEGALYGCQGWINIADNLVDDSIISINFSCPYLDKPNVVEVVTTGVYLASVATKWDQNSTALGEITIEIDKT